MSEPEGFLLESSVFKNGEMIPSRYTCDGNRLLNPPLSWSGMPERTVSFALLVDDPDIPAEITKERGITVFDHWVVINIPADVREIREGETAGVVGTNSAGTQTYRGPCPPKEYLPTKHRYFFRLYALDSELALNSEATKKDVLEATEGHVLASTELMGVYEKM